MADCFRDDNDVPIHDPAGLRPMAEAARIASANTGAATAEVDISAIVGTAQRNRQGCAVVRLVVATNPCFYAFDAAGAAASHTGATNMIYLPAGHVEYVRIKSTDVSFYHLQSGGAGALQLAVME